MDSVEHSNRIAGERAPARDGGTYELRDPRDRARVLGLWPRSGAADWNAAREAARRTQPEGGSWKSAGERRALFQRALERLEGEPDPSGLAAASLGLEPPELAGLVGRRIGEARAQLDRADFGAPGAAPRVVLWRPHWGELVAAGPARLLAFLARGDALVLAADRIAPALADRLEEALRAEGLPPGMLSLVHGLDDATLKEASPIRGFDLVACSGHAALERRLSCGAEGEGAPPDPNRFGAGVVDPGWPELAFERLRSVGLSVGLDGDVEERARELAARAFGRAESLSGQLPGRVGRVRCHPRVLSRFTAALLATLADDPDFAEPVPALEPDQPRELRRIRDLGLDEGATLIHEGRAGGEGAGTGRSEDGPLVFTNVEPYMQVASADRPLPVLLLLRDWSAGEPPPGLGLALPPGRR